MRWGKKVKVVREEKGKVASLRATDMDNVGIAASRDIRQENAQWRASCTEELEPKVKAKVRARPRH